MKLMAGLVPDRGRGDWSRRGFAIPRRLICHTQSSEELRRRKGPETASVITQADYQRAARALAVRCGRRREDRASQAIVVTGRMQSAGQLQRDDNPTVAFAGTQIHTSHRGTSWSRDSGAPSAADALTQTPRAQCPGDQLR